MKIKLEKGCYRYIALTESDDFRAEIFREVIYGEDRRTRVSRERSPNQERYSHRLKLIKSKG